jgi:16S rRNA (adenine(1408)-N(1))-methyltransferase
LFVEAAVENLPPELDGIAQEVRIQFPWGSLLQAVVHANPAVMNQLRRICRNGALLNVIVSIDPVRDRSEIERLNLPALHLHYVQQVLTPAYKKSGFYMMETGILSEIQYSSLKSSWARRLRRNTNGQSLYWIARMKEDSIEE